MTILACHTSTTKRRLLSHGQERNMRQQTLKNNVWKECKVVFYQNMNIINMFHLILYVTSLTRYQASVCVRACVSVEGGLFFNSLWFVIFSLYAKVAKQGLLHRLQCAFWCWARREKQCQTTQCTTVLVGIKFNLLKLNMPYHKKVLRNILC